MGCGPSAEAKERQKWADPDDWTSLHKGARKHYVSDDAVNEEWEHGALLGVGSFGRVDVITKKNAPYKGTNYACKVYGLRDYIDEHGEVWPACDEGALSREINLIQALGSAEWHVMQIYGVLETPTSVHLVLERCDTDLLRYVASLEDGSFPEPAAAAYAKQLLRAVVHCHERNVMHRHINLEDLLLRRQAGAYALCLGDFGHATAFVKGKVLRRPKNSAIYASPEEIVVGEYDEKIDVWSCGVVVLCLVGGLGDVDTRAYRALHKRGVRGALQLCPHARSEPLVALLEDLLARDPANRASAKAALKHHDGWLSAASAPIFHAGTEAEVLDDSARRCFTANARSALARADLEREVNRNIRRAPSEERNALACAIKDAALTRHAEQAHPGHECATPSVCFRKSVQKVILANRRARNDVLDDVLCRDDVLTVAQLRDALKHVRAAEPETADEFEALAAALEKVENNDTILTIELSPLVKDRRAYFAPPPEQNLDASRHVRFRYDVEG